VLEFPSPLSAPDPSKGALARGALRFSRFTMRRIVSRLDREREVCSRRKGVRALRHPDRADAVEERLDAFPPLALACAGYPQEYRCAESGGLPTSWIECAKPILRKTVGDLAGTRARAIIPTLQIVRSGNNAAATEL
jgi:hypothetical protein